MKIMVDLHFNSNKISHFAEIATTITAYWVSFMDYFCKITFSCIVSSEFQIVNLVFKVMLLHSVYNCI